MKLLKYIIIASTLIGVFACSSKDDLGNSPDPVADFDYEVVAGSGVVKFINKSANADVYSWEFGDNLNKSSTDENPSFEYGIPGTYSVEVVLYAGNGTTGQHHNVSKSIQLTDVPAQVYISLDGEVDDWECVPYVEDIDVTGEFKRIKVWGADSDNIYVLIEGTQYLNDLSSSAPGILFDIDNNESTGIYNTDWYPFAIGVEMQCDGSKNWGANFTGRDNTNDWAWDWFEEKNWINISDRIEIDSSTVAYEFGISKSTLRELASKTLSDEGIKIGFTDKAGSLIPNGAPIFISFNK